MPCRITETNCLPSPLVAGIDLEKGPAVVKYDFSGHVALVTGGTKGIGRSIALALLQTGAQVVATYSRDQEAAGLFQNALSSAQAAANMAMR